MDKSIYRPSKSYLSNWNTQRVMRWRLIIEEISPELIYLKGETNIVANALSKLEINMSKLQSEDMQNMRL